MSIIEHAIYAHDSERKWIQGHPTIIYEGMLVTNIIRSVIELFERENTQTSRLFAIAPLLPQGYDFILKAENDGKILESQHTIRLLADEDILFYAKSHFYDDTLVHQYYNRNKRSFAIWKSESAYKALFDEEIGGKKRHSKIVDGFERLERYINERTVDGSELKLVAINQATIDCCNEEIKKLQVAKTEGQLQPGVFEDQMKGHENALKWSRMLKNIAESQNAEFEFYLVTARRFSSNFSKSEIEQIYVFFPETGYAHRAKDVSNILDAEILNNQPKYFYLYHSRKSADGKAEVKINPSGLVEAIISEAGRQ